MKPKTQWAWIDGRNIEAESWNHGGTSRAEAIKAGHRARFRRFVIAPCRHAIVIAPCRHATKRDVREWIGDNDLQLGDWMVDTDRAEFLPKRRRIRANHSLGIPVNDKK